MIDSKGFRLNVGIVLINREKKLFWAKRVGMKAWQFPQGGIQIDESPEQALFRELKEEIGLLKKDVEIIGCTKGWLKYKLPKRFIRTSSVPLCIGQKQKYFLLRLLADDSQLNLLASEVPEFEAWRWVDFWHPVTEVVSFKKEVYKKALQELEPLIYKA